MVDTLYWVWLAENTAPGRSDAAKLLEHFPGGAKEVYEAEDPALLSTEGCSQTFLKRLTNKDLSKAERILEYCFLNGISIIPCTSPRYPKRLHSLYNKPTVLYVRGRIEDLDERFCVSIVGARDMSAYGKHMTFTLARQLIGYGAIIIRGAAYGIDSAANSTALFMGEPTVAVLGSGVDVPYPQRNKDMLDSIAGNGMVISEFAPGTPPIGRNFPIRNRIISGLADALIVVEAGEKSGSLITARCAADQGRAVYAVPGNLGAPNSVGTNRMIRDGARIVTCAEDIVVDFADRFNIKKIERIVNTDKYQRYEYNCFPPVSKDNMPVSQKDKDGAASRAKANTAVKNLTEKVGLERPKAIFSSEANRAAYDPRGKAAGRVPGNAGAAPAKAEAIPAKEEKMNPAAANKIIASLDAVQKRVLDIMPSGSSVTTDKIAAAGIPADQVMSSLTILELYGAVEALPGGLYKKLI